MNIYSEIQTCSPDRLKRLKELGVNTKGTKKALEQIIRKHGFGLPGEYWETFKQLNKNGEIEVSERLLYGFYLNHKEKWTRITLTYEDALAEEIILLKELGLIIK